MNIAAFDLSLNSTGFCDNDGPETLAPPKHLRPAKGSDASEPRLDWILKQVRYRVGGQALEIDGQLQQRDRPDLVVIEGYSYGPGNKAHQIGELGGLVRMMLWESGLPVVKIAPTKLKKLATGKGNAPKDTVLAEAIRRLGYQGASHDEADAMWLWAMAALRHGELPELKLPVAHTVALDGVVWPGDGD